MNKKQKIILYIIITLNIIVTTYCNYKTTCAINELEKDIECINSDLQQYQNEEVSRDW